jgi:hypothetical protein
MLVRLFIRHYYWPLNNYYWGYFYLNVVAEKEYKFDFKLVNKKNINPKTPKIA